MSWDDLFSSYLAARRENDSVVTEKFVKKARIFLSTATPTDLDILSAALEENERKWFVAAIFSRSPVPKRLLKAMLRAGVYEVNPSLNQYFIEPCISSYGHRVVNEALLEVLENGNDFEKAGAVNALYWAGMTLYFDDYKRGFALENATPESRAAYLELMDVWERKRCLLLREFIANENVDVRRCIIPSLNLDKADYPDQFKPLLAQAVEIARNHDDDYIRHRVEVQLGNEHLLKPLPHRDTLE